jgi:hypothetical protein
MEVSKKIGVPLNHPCLVGFSRILHETNHPFWGSPIYGNPHIAYQLGMGANFELTWKTYFGLSLEPC